MRSRTRWAGRSCSRAASKRASPGSSKAWEGSEDPEVAAHLGETLWRMGRTAEAKKLWDEALAANPDSRPLKRAIERRAQ